MADWKSKLADILLSPKAQGGASAAELKKREAEEAAAEAARRQAEAAEAARKKAASEITFKRGGPVKRITAPKKSSW